MQRYMQTALYSRHNSKRTRGPPQQSVVVPSTQRDTACVEDNVLAELQMAVM